MLCQCTESQTIFPASWKRNAAYGSLEKSISGCRVHKTFSSAVSDNTTNFYIKVAQEAMRPRVWFFYVSDDAECWKMLIRP